MTREQEPFDSVAEGRSELGRWIVEALSDQGYATNVTTRLCHAGPDRAWGAHSRIHNQRLQEAKPPTSTGMRATRGGALPGGVLLTPSPR